MTPTPEQQIRDILQKVHDDAVSPSHDKELGYSEKAVSLLKTLLQTQSSQLLSEVEAIISSNPQDFKDMTPGETKSLINKRLSLLRSKWEGKGK